MQIDDLIDWRRDYRHQWRVVLSSLDRRTKAPVTKSGGRPPIGEKAMTGAERRQAPRHSPSAYAKGLGHYFPSTPLLSE